MKKFLILIPILLLILLATPVFAQEQPDILEIENGLVMGYDLNTGNIDQTQRFGINFNLSDSIDAGFMFQQGANQYAGGSFLLLRYALVENLGLSLMYGDVGTPAGGVMVSYDLLSNNVEDISTVLRVNMEYLLQDITGPVEDGIFGVSLSLGFGI
ncbi:MAG: hypothetical protein ACLFQW_07870 [Spirochaetaceae bacterium]